MYKAKNISAKLKIILHGLLLLSSRQNNHRRFFYKSTSVLTMLSNLQQFALQVNSCAFWYMPKIPVRFDPSWRYLYINISPVKWIMESLLFINLLFHGCICGIIAVYYGFSSQVKEISWIHIDMFIFACLLITYDCFLTLSIAHNRNTFVSSINEVIKINRVLSNAGY